MNATNHRSLRLWLFVWLAVVAAGFGGAVVVHHRHGEAERSQVAAIGEEWEQDYLLAQSDYVRLRGLIKEVQSHDGVIKDPDLAWALALLRDNPRPIVRSRVLGMLSLLGKRRGSPAPRGGESAGAPAAEIALNSGATGQGERGGGGFDGIGGGKPENGPTPTLLSASSQR